MDQIAPLPLALLALAGGYQFIKTFRNTSYRAARVEGHRLFFEAATYAIFLAVAARGLIRLSSSLTPVLHQRIVDAWNSAIAVPVRSLPTFTLAFALGCLLPWFLNPFIPRWKITGRVIRRDGSELENLLYDSMNRRLPVFITLRSRKVYVGWAVWTFKPTRVPSTDFRILPLLSGYRAEDKLWVAFTTQYADVYEKIDAEKKRITEKIKAGTLTEDDSTEMAFLNADAFEVVIQIGEVVSASLYSFGLGREAFQIYAPISA